MECSGVHFSVRVDSFAGGAAGGAGGGFPGSTSQRHCRGSLAGPQQQDFGSRVQAADSVGCREMSAQMLLTASNGVAVMDSSAVQAMSLRKKVF